MAKTEKVNGILLTSYAMAIINKGKTGVIADLHIGMEELNLLTSRFQTADMLRRVLYCIEKYEIDNIIIAGDIKHGFGKNVVQEWDEIRQFFEVLKERVKIKVVKGNHDFYIQNILRDFNIEVKDYYRVDNYIIAHGDKNVLRGNEVLIIGNEHPSIVLKDEVGARVKLRCYVFFEKEKILVLPSFNYLTRGSNVINNEWLSPILKNVDLDNAKIYAIEEESEEVLYFGPVKIIKSVMYKSS